MRQKIVILPVQEQRDNTPFENADETTVATAQEHGFEIVGPDDGNATAIDLVRLLDSAIIEQTLAANPPVSSVQLPFSGVESFLPLAKPCPDVSFTPATASRAPPVAQHALSLTLAVMRYPP